MLSSTSTELNETFDEIVKKLGTGMSEYEQGSQKDHLILPLDLNQI